MPTVREKAMVIIPVLDLWCMNPCFPLYIKYIIAIFAFLFNRLKTIFKEHGKKRFSEDRGTFADDENIVSGLFQLHFCCPPYKGISHTRRVIMKR